MAKLDYNALLDELDTEAGGLGGAVQAIEDDTLFFYGDVSESSALQFLSQLNRMERALIRKAASTDAEFMIQREMSFRRTPLRIHINSYGGELFAGFAIADSMSSRTRGVQTVSVIEGICASAATLIAMSANEVTMRENAVMLVHQHSGWFEGTYEQFNDEKKLNEILLQRIVNFYVNHTKLNEEEIRAMLKRDYWMDAQEALEKGFVHKVV